jgi:LysM repeat protein
MLDNISFIILFMKKMRFLLLTAVLLLTLIPVGSVSSESLSPDPDELIDMINVYRLNNAVPEVDTDSALMSAAQAHADYLASTFDTSYPSTESGSVGEGDTYVRDRVIAAGYNLTAGMNVIENIAAGGADTTLTDVLYRIWAVDDDQKANLLNIDAVAMGVGISESESGSLYFVMDMGVQYGSGNSASDTNSGVYSTMPTLAVTAAVALVQVAAPQEDGRIVHIVDAGQALWSIASAYDITLEQLLDLNNLSEDSVITVGQEIVVQVGYTATPEPTVTATLRPPTRTPVPAQTAQAVEVPEEDEPDDNTGGFLGMSRQTMGLTLILICGAGLALIVLGNSNKKKAQAAKKDKKDDDDLPGPDFEI